MHAVIAILAALVRRGATGEGAYLDVSVADGVVALMSLVRRRVPRDRRGARAGPQHPHRPLRLLRRRTAAPTATGSRSARSSRTFYANLCRALGCEQWVDAPDRRRGAGRRSAPTSRAAFADASPRRVGRRRSARPTRAWRRCASVPELVDDAQFRARGVFVEAEHPDRGDFRPGRLGARGHGPRRRGPTSCRDATVTDTDELLARGGPRADEIASLRDARSRGMTRPSPAVADDVPRRSPTRSARCSTRRPASSPSSGATSGRRARRSRTATRCSGTTPSPSELTGGPIAPPTMLSVWFRPHHWAPGRTEQALPLQVHFDLKAALRACPKR